MKVLRLGTRTLNNVCGIIRPVSDGPDDDERPGLRLSRSRAPCGLKDQSRTDKRVRFTQLTNKTQISVFPGPHADRQFVFCVIFHKWKVFGAVVTPCWSNWDPPFICRSVFCLCSRWDSQKRNNTLCCVIYTLSVVLCLLFIGNFW